MRGYNGVNNETRTSAWFWPSNGHLRAKGVRITETRKAVIDYIIQSHDHPSAEMIYQDLKPNFPNMSLATVYNNLKVPDWWGFCRWAQGSQWYDNLLLTLWAIQHLNVICEKCGAYCWYGAGTSGCEAWGWSATGYPHHPAKRLSMAYWPNASRRRCDCEDD